MLWAGPSRSSPRCWSERGSLTRAGAVLRLRSWWPGLGGSSSAEAGGTPTAICCWSRAATRSVFELALLGVGQHRRCCAAAECHGPPDRPPARPAGAGRIGRQADMRASATRYSANFWEIDAQPDRPQRRRPPPTARTTAGSARDPIFVLQCDTAPFHRPQPLGTRTARTAKDGASSVKLA